LFKKIIKKNFIKRKNLLENLLKGKIYKKNDYEKIFSKRNLLKWKNIYIKKFVLDEKNLLKGKYLLKIR